MDLLNRPMEHRVGAPCLCDRDCAKGRKVFPFGKRVGGQLCLRVCGDERYQIISCRASGVHVSYEGLGDLPEACQNLQVVLLGTKL